MKTNTMKTLSKLTEVVTANGNCLRGHVEVNGKEFQIESDGKTWLSIIDGDSRCETCIIDEDGTVLADGGEYVTDGWTEAEWEKLKNLVSQ